MSNVFLVGAGPGDPELLTVKAHQLLRQADVVLHDDLVSREVLEIVRAEAVVINVGKRCGNKLVTQGQIHVATEAKIPQTIHMAPNLPVHRPLPELDSDSNDLVLLAEY